MKTSGANSLSRALVQNAHVISLHSPRGIALQIYTPASKRLGDELIDDWRRNSLPEGYVMIEWWHSFPVQSIGHRP